MNTKTYVHSYTENSEASVWFSENMMLANTISGAQRRWQRGKK